MDLRTRLKEWGALASAIAAIFVVVMGTSGFLLASWGDERYVLKGELGLVVTKISCLSAETQRDQVYRIMQRFTEDTDEMVRANYTAQLEKHNNRLTANNCALILD